MSKPLSHAERGRLGGRATARKYGPDYMRRIGRKGGYATLEKHGPEHLRKIGKKGFLTTLRKYFDGDKQALIDDLVARGNWAQAPYINSLNMAFLEPPAHPAHKE